MENLLGALIASFEPVNLALVITGSVVGLIFGIVPGLQNVTALSILLPFTYAMVPRQAFILMTAIYAAGVFGGAITAILYRIPGAPENAATVFDGHPLALKGRAAEALGTAIACSAAGGLFSTAVLIIAAPQIAPLALKFGPSEYFGLVFFALCLVAMVGDSYLKTFISVLLGLLFATVGLSTVTGQARFTFGTDFLLGGFDFVVIIIGMFAIAEVLARAGRKEEGTALVDISKVKPKLPSVREFMGYGPTFLRSSVLGTIIGILPALGATVAAFLAYEMERRLSKNPREFGTGILKGVAAPEAANNASVGGAFIPLLTLGIPGSGSTAVMLGAFLIYGLQPGASLFEKADSVAYVVFATMIVANLMIIVGGLLMASLFARLVQIPFAYMAPIIVVLCAIGAYTVRYNISDLWSMFAFGVVGYLLDRFGFSAPVFVLAFILGDIAESAFRRSMMIFDDDPFMFFSRPVSAVLVGLGLVILAWVAGQLVLTVLRGRTEPRASANLKLD